MRVNYAYVYMGDKETPPVSGNEEVKVLLRLCPWLKNLVHQLVAEKNWSRAHSQTANDWSALFSVGFKGSVPIVFSLELHPSRASLKVPPLKFELYKPPSFREVENHIIANLQRA